MSAKKQVAKQVRKQLGVTLVGMCVTLAISATLLGKALPAMTGAQQHQQLRAEADQLRSDIQETRQLTVMQGRDLRLHVESACYIVHDGASGACQCDADRREAVCEGQTQVLKIRWTQASLSSNRNGDLSFSAQHGSLPQMGSLTLRGRSGEELRQVIAITGRVRTCAVGRTMMKGSEVNGGGRWDIWAGRPRMSPEVLGAN